MIPKNPNHEIKITKIIYLHLKIESEIFDLIRSFIRSYLLNISFYQVESMLKMAAEQELKRVEGLLLVQEASPRLEFIF